MDGDAYRVALKDEGYCSCLSPRILLSRWFCGKKSAFVSNVVERRKGKEKKIVMASINGESSSVSAPAGSGQQREVSFNLGLGFGLIYLVVASKNELNKLQNLQKEMEILLQSLKDRFQNHAQDDAVSLLPSKQNKSISPPKGDISSQEIFPSSCYLEDSDITKCYISRQQSRKKMDLLEAELEAELEHLQLQLDSELIFYSKQQYTEISVEDTAPEESLNRSFGEVIDPPKVVHNEEEHGVCPSELERRLHEVLEDRQLERIKELELALDRAKQKIHEKEREIFWWKDTAKLVYQHVPPSLTTQL